jgi:hypothetical protein
VIAHDLPLAASLEFSCSGIAGWPVCGDQLAPRFGSTRPQTVFRLFSEAATREAVPLWNQTDDQFVQLGLTGI